MADPDPKARFFVRHDEASKTVRRSLVALVGFGLFCALTLFGASDVEMVIQRQITIPFANTGIPYSGFLIVGPLILFGLSVYLHLHLGYLNSIESDAVGSGAGKLFASEEELWKDILPYLFNWSRPVTGTVIADLCFYLLAPLVLLSFCYEAQPKAVAPLLRGATILASAWLAIVCLSRSSSGARLGPRYGFFKRFVLPPATLLLGLAVWWLPERPIDLRNTVALRGRVVIAEDLTGALLAGADLGSTVLRDSVLSGADLRGAILAGADLRGVDFTGAVLEDATLAGADLAGADLRAVEGLECDELASAENWEASQRDPALLCPE